MLKKVGNFIKRLHEDEGGNYFVEMALVLILLTLAIAGNATNLQTQGIAPKYTGITTELNAVSVPTLH